MILQNNKEGKTTYTSSGLIFFYGVAENPEINPSFLMIFSN
jgi:hypothetical protein